MSDTDVSVKELGEGAKLTVDEFLRSLISQLFDNDNDETTLKAKMTATDGTSSDIEFLIRIASIDGVKPREEADSNG